MIFHLKRIAAVSALLSAFGSNPASAQVRLHGVWRNRCVYTRHVSRWECRGGYSERERGGAEPLRQSGLSMDRRRRSRNYRRPHGYGFDFPRREDDCGRRARCSGIKNAAVWQGGTNWKLLGGVPGGAPQELVLSVAYGVSGDGSVVVGIAYLPSSQQFGSQFHGFRWQASTGMVDLGALQQGGNTSGLAIAADGSTIVGYERPANKGTDLYNPSVSGSSGAIF